MPHNLSPSQEVFSWLFSLQLTAVGAWQTGQKSFWFSVQRLSLHWMAWQYGVENLQRQFYEHVHSFSVWQMSFSLSLDLGDWVLLDWASSSVHIKALYRKPRGQKFRNGPALFLPICNLAQFLSWFLQKINLDRTRSCGVLQFYIWCWNSSKMNSIVFLCVLPLKWFQY